MKDVFSFLFKHTTVFSPIKLSKKNRILLRNHFEKKKLITTLSLLPVSP